MVHYNFPGFSVGDTKPIGPTNRRELGHGNLAKRALEPTIKKDNSQTIRVVSEILESNGSSSMATVCGGSMALAAAGVELENLVAGVAMGLVCENDRYAVLTDIMGLEDFEGDMDFKIAGTLEGVTAMQMDIKLYGVKAHILKEAITQSRIAKEHILGIMNEASTKIITSNALPKVVEFSIHPSKIVDVIGKAGSVIREIIETYEVAIDLDRDNGGVKLSGKDSAKLEAAKEHILELTNTPIKEAMQFEINKSYIGKVKKIVDFGIFVEMPDGFDALLHNSKMDKIKQEDWSTKYTVGQEIEVIVMEQSGKKIDLATPEFVA
jgi:polyribonucleotide nucleotidyltransferase